MENFILDLDMAYMRARRNEKIKKGNKNFWIYVPIKIKLFGIRNTNYMAKKGEFTKFIYVKNNCRVYFSDADILTMLLQVKNRDTIDMFIEKLKEMYAGNAVKYEIELSGRNYEVEGLQAIYDEQILTNPQDIDISFNELLVLINLVLSKDKAATPLWTQKPDFLKHTICKYISLLKFYYYGDNNAREYLEVMGFNTQTDIYTNYDTKAKRDEKSHFFCDFDLFEKAGIL